MGNGLLKKTLSPQTFNYSTLPVLSDEAITQTTIHGITSRGFSFSVALLPSACAFLKTALKGARYEKTPQTARSIVFLWEDSLTSNRVQKKIMPLLSPMFVPKTVGQRKQKPLYFLHDTLQSFSLNHQVHDQCQFIGSTFL